jgi:hypothetical protein
MAAMRSSHLMDSSATHAHDGIECPAGEVKEGLDVHFVDNYDDLYKIALEYDAGPLTPEGPGTPVSQTCPPNDLSFM